jgi:hypothetical protein
VVDLMAALKQSLSEVPKKPPQKETAAHHAKKAGKKRKAS